MTEELACPMSLLETFGRDNRSQVKVPAENVSSQQVCLGFGPVGLLAYPVKALLNEMTKIPGSRSKPPGGIFASKIA